MTLEKVYRQGNYLGRQLHFVLADRPGYNTSSNLVAMSSTCGVHVALAIAGF